MFVTLCVLMRKDFTKRVRALTTVEKAIEGDFFIIIRDKLLIKASYFRQKNAHGSTIKA